MDIIDHKTTAQLLQSMLAELAKAQNEITCAERDIRKAQGRQAFVLMIVNRMINRQEIDR